MHNAIPVLLAAAWFCLVGIPKDSSATITVTLEWGACGGGAGGCALGYGGGALGTDTIDVGVGGGQTLRLDVFLSHDVAGGLKVHSFSLNFDT